MKHIPVYTVIRMLRIALGYGSRTERLTRLVNSVETDVQITAHSLMALGYLRPDEGTIIIDPK